VVAAALLFNLGQGALRPTLPLYLQQVLGANYRMVTLIPVAFGAGKWLASLPTGYLLCRLGGRRLMVAGLVVIATCDVASVTTAVFELFLGIRGVGGMGWAMFGVVATTVMVDRGGPRRGRAISLLLMSESIGLLLGSMASGWLYRRAGPTSPFLLEAACMLLGARLVGWRLTPAGDAHVPDTTRSEPPRLRHVLAGRGVLLMSATNAAVTAVQTGALVFLFPLYLVERGQARPEVVGTLIGLGVLGRLGALWLAGSLSDRADRTLVLGIGLVGFGAAVGSVVLMSDLALLSVWSVFVGAGAGFVAGLPTAILGDRVAPSARGIAMGWLRTVTDVGMLGGPILMGALADGVDLAAPFVVSGALLCGLGGVCYRHARRQMETRA
jgi:MFS family permease